MTHKDIYEKFMIEYDKANITSSYPSLTKYEIATILDKAYLALIAQKLTGNNQRKVSFEGDIKAIEDLRPLVVSKVIKRNDNIILHSSNESAFKIPSEMMYYVSSVLCKNKDVTSLDKVSHSTQNIKIIPREIASKFMATDSNMPWISNPVAFMENSNLYVLYDSYMFTDSTPEDVIITFLKKPNTFMSSLVDDSNNLGGNGSKPNIPDTDPDDPDDPYDEPSPEQRYVFILDLSKLDDNDKIK